MTRQQRLNLWLLRQYLLRTTSHQAILIYQQLSTPL